MGDGFTVDLAVLSGAVEAIAGAAEQLGPAVAGPMAIPAQSAGHDGLAQALDTLGKAARTGIGHLVDDLHRFRSGLAECHATYQRQEQDICRALSGSEA